MMNAGFDAGGGTRTNARTRERPRSPDDTTFSEMLTQFLGRESFMVRHLLVAGKYTVLT